MSNNINENPDKISEIESGGVELASLVGTYFSKDNFKEILKEDFKLIKRLKRGLEGLKNGSKNKVKDIIDGEEVEYKKEETSKLEKIIKEKEKKYNEKKDELKKGIDVYIRGKLGEDFENNGIEEDDDSLDYILSEGLEVNDLERIRELYSNEDVRSLYLDELNKRKDKFEIINNGKKGVFEILKIESTIKKAEKIILSLRVKSFISGKSLTPAEVSKIKQIQKKIKQEERKINQLLNSRENATVYRLNKLKNWKKELEDSGFVTFESRKKIIDEGIENIIMGENVILTGATGTGKTVLALKILKILYPDYNPKVISGHSGITTSEFIAKPILKSDGKGGTTTGTQLGKLLKSFVEGSIPIIDEIDLIPNDILMRVKHLFTLKPGDKYSPQEDGDEEYILKKASVISTANIKSEKHPDREELDPAIVRLYKGIQIPFLSKEEAYDLAIMNLMESQGYIYGLSKEELGKEGILFNLIKALKEIEDSYLGKGSDLSISLRGSDRSGVYLQKAILETGNFISMFKGFKESGLSFKQFIKTKIVKFISNESYPLSDRLLLIKIFSQNGLIIKSDIGLLEDRMIDVDRDDLDRNIMSDNDIFKDSGTKFIDSYDLANLDPYEIRKLDEIGFSDNTKKQKEFLQYLAKSSVKNEGNKNRYEIGVIANRLLEDMEGKKDFGISKEDIDSLIELAGKSGFENDFAEVIKNLGGYFLEKFEAVVDELIKKFKEGEKFVCIESDGEYWFVDRDGNGTPGKYFWDSIGEYKDGVAIGEKDDIYGLINKEGKLISNFYDYIDDFKEGFAQVKKGKKRGFIDTDGNEIGELVYDDVWDFKEGFAIVKKGKKLGFIDTNGNEIGELVYDDVEDFSNGFARVEKDEKWGFINTKGELISNFYDYVSNFSGGFAAVKKGKKLGFIDTNGNEFPNFYDDVWNFNEGFARVEKDEKWGFIDTDGNEIGELVYDDVWDFKEGFAIVKKGKKLGFIDTNGNEFPNFYDDVWNFNEGFARVEKGGKWGFIDTNGNEIGELVYDDVEDFSNGFAQVEKGDKRGFIDTDGNEIGELVYDYVRDFKEGFARVEKGGKWGFIDTDGNEFPNFYDDVWNFNEGFATVGIGGKYGFIDEEGKEISNFYDSISSFSGGFAQVKKGDKRGFIDTDGKEFPNFYDDVWDFNEGFARVEKGEKYGFIDTDGNEIGELVYDDVGHFNEGFAKVRKDEKRGFIDTNLNEIGKLVYDYVWDFNEGFAKVRKDEKRGFIDTNGKFCKKIPKK